jgi:hypothetical protein
MARQLRSFALKKKTSHAGREKPPNPIPRPHTRARNPVNGPVRNVCFGKHRASAEISPPLASIIRPVGGSNYGR